MLWECNESSLCSQESPCLAGQIGNEVSSEVSTESSQPTLGLPDDLPEDWCLH